MKTFYLTFVFTLATLVSMADTSPAYEVTDIIPPPSKFGTQQIDGLDFLPDGRLAACLPSGEIFFYDPDKKEWQLFAEGLHNPLGMVAISDSELVVSQRPELTRVRDTDGDGKADSFEAMNGAFGMSGNYHEFHFTPVRDEAGAFYFSLGTGSSGDGVRAIVRGRFDERGRPGRMHASTPFRGCVLKWTPDGRTVPWAYGFRTPNGLGFDLKGNLFVTDNQGDWVGTSKLFHVKEGRFYGHAASLTWKKDFEGAPLETAPEVLAKLRTRAAVVFPHGAMANSPTQILPIKSESMFGPFTGQLLVGEMNQPRIMRVMLEEVGGELQGACIPFIDGAPLRPGVNRLAWAPDGSLYVGHSKHIWVGNEGLQRVAWNGKSPFEVHTMTLTGSGFRFHFTEPVDKVIASKKETWPFKRYYYYYHRTYGSPRVDETPIEIDSIEISPDQKTVEVNLRELKAWHIHEVNIKGLTNSAGIPLTNTYIVYTLNRLLNGTPPEPLQTNTDPTRNSNPGTNVARAVNTDKPIPVKDPEGTVFTASDAKRNGPTLAFYNSGFTGLGYLDYGSGKQSISWTVNSKVGGSIKLVFRYALAGSSRPLKLQVNNEDIETLPFPESGGWTVWKDMDVEVLLEAGKNTVSLLALDKSGPNIDHLQVVQR
jgi:glucose/arabinose dehydrogenase